MKNSIKIACLSILALGFPQISQAQLTIGDWQFFPSGIEYKRTYESGNCKKLIPHSGMTFAMVTVNITNISQSTRYLSPTDLKKSSLVDDQNQGVSVSCVDTEDGSRIDDTGIGANETRYIRLLFHVPHNYNPQEIFLRAYGKQRLKLYKQ